MREWWRKTGKTRKTKRQTDRDSSEETANGTTYRTQKRVVRTQRVIKGPPPNAHRSPGLGKEEVDRSGPAKVFERLLWAGWL